jgi:radical SAM superfamily enzyme YgiQ (UPF0313 family)
MNNPIKSPIILSTLNARYSHCSFGLRYLLANLEELQPSAQIMEFTIAQNPRDIVEALVSLNPSVIGFGVYIWNARQTLEVVSTLKRVRPDIKVVLGGPEVSYETESQAICQLADLTIRGEADFLFRDVCRAWFSEGKWPVRRWISGELPEIKSIRMPYSLYNDHDIQNRVIYVEASRGCPYKCEYCLSSLDKSVRSFEIDLFLEEMDRLIQRGVRQFKFVDRTFNLSVATGTRILKFFLDRINLGLFLHFEMVPDRLPLELRDLIKQFPKGSLQFEVGIQTWSPEVARLVSRRQDYSKISENFAFLNQETGVHTHADLIVGLPGETLESFADGFDAVAALKPDEVQVGILKRLRGTPIIRHDREWEMVYQEHAPYQVLRTKTMGFETIQRMTRFAHFWDLVANSGNFKHTMAIVSELSSQRSAPSLFWEMDEMSSYLSKKHPQGHSVALLNLLESVWTYLRGEKKVDEARLKEALIRDYSLDHEGRTKRDVPVFLRDQAKGAASPASGAPKTSATPKRQLRHLANA